MNEIPEMTNPLGRYWQQPDRAKITVTDEAATMDKQTFDALLEYSSSVPTGVYVGKMWKALTKHGPVLHWYDVSPQGEKYCSIQERMIVVTTQTTLTCPNCGSTDIEQDYDGNGVVIHVNCEDCGHVLFDQDSEWDVEEEF